MSIVLFFSSLQISAHPIRNFLSNQSSPGRFDNIGIVLFETINSYRLSDVRNITVVVSIFVATIEQSKMVRYIFPTLNNVTITIEFEQCIHNNVIVTMRSILLQ